MYNERLVICNNCNEKTIIIKLKNTEFYKCNKCNCPLSAKLRATNEKCPLNKW